MGYHSADYDHDWKISAPELARVVALAGTVNSISGNVTGCYKVNPATVDGFDFDTSREVVDPVTLSQYHSADYNKDGRIDSAEVARVTEIYNYRFTTDFFPAWVRTGQYFSGCPGTLDGFGLGPVYLSSYSFDSDHIPTIHTNAIPTAPDGYILRAKFTNVPAEYVQSTTTVNNNGLPLDIIPPPGTYIVMLYWVAFGGTNPEHIGNEQPVIVTIAPPDDACTNANQKCVCGDPVPVSNEDKGKCFPRRTKITCEAPVIQNPPCNDEEYYTIYDPNSTPKFKVVAKLMDSSCEPITDESGNPILTTLA